MKRDPLIEHCRKLPGATEDVKWGNDLIFSVGGKMFAGFQLPDGEPIGFKVEPGIFQAMVGKNGVITAPYMAKHKWVLVQDPKKVGDTELKELIAKSHALILSRLPKKLQVKLAAEPAPQKRRVG